MEIWFVLVFLAVVGLFLQTRKLKRRIDAFDALQSRRAEQQEAERERDSDHTSDKVSSRCFELLDDEGKTRARLHCKSSFGSEVSQPQLSLIDENGRMRGGLWLDDKGCPELHFTNLDNGDGCRMHLGFDDEGYPQLLMYDKPKDGGYDPALRLAVSRAEWVGGSGDEYQNESKNAGLAC
jgi:hypothetical protein